MFACGKDYCEATPGKTGEAARSGKHGRAHCREGPASVTLFGCNPGHSWGALSHLDKAGFMLQRGFQISQKETELLS